MGRSRLTRPPAWRSPSALRASVWGPRSKARCSPSPATAVRHTPFTARLEPSSMPSRVTVARTTSLAPCRWTTLPASSTMPVNMSVRSPPDVPLDDPVVTHGADGDVLEANILGKGQPRPADGTRCVVAAQEHGGAERHDTVDEARLEERPGELAAAFHEYANDVERPEPREQIAHVHASLVRLAAKDREAARLERGHTLGVGGVGDGDDGPIGAGGALAPADDARVDGQTRPAVHHDPQRLAGPPRAQPNVQRGIVGERGTDAHHHRVGPATQPARLEARAPAGDPAGEAAAIGDLAVDGGRPLERDVRPAEEGGGDEDAIEKPRLPLAASVHHLDARGGERGHAAPDHAWIRIGHRCHHAPDASCP